MMIKKILAVGLLGMFAAGAFAQDSETQSVLKLTVDESVRLALENNVSVKKSELALKLKNRLKKSAWSSVSPTASLSGSYTDDFEKDSYSYGASGNISLSLAPSLYSTVKKAVLAYDAGELSYEATLRSVELNVRKSFYNILYQKENLASQERSLETAQQTYDANYSKYNRGQLSELDLLNSQYNLESKKPVITSLKNAYNNDLASFKQTLGIGLSIAIQLEGNLNDAVINIDIPESVLHSNLDEMPSIKVAQNSVDSAKAGLLASRFSAYGPSVTAGYTYGKNKQQGAEDFTTTNQLSLGIKIPLDGYLPWSTGALSVASQKESLQELELELDDQKTSAAITVRNSYNTILQAQSQLETLKKNVQLMQRSYDMSRIAYNNGSKDLLTLQTAEDNLLNAKTALSQQEFTLISNILSLESTLGVPFGTFTKTANNSDSNGDI